MIIATQANNVDKAAKALGKIGVGDGGVPGMSQVQGALGAMGGVMDIAQGAMQVSEFMNALSLPNQEWLEEVKYTSTQKIGVRQVISTDPESGKLITQNALGYSTCLRCDYRETYYRFGVGVGIFVRFQFVAGRKESVQNGVSARTR